MLAYLKKDRDSFMKMYYNLASFVLKARRDGKAVKMSDSLKALEWLDEHLKDKNEQNNIVNDGFLEALNASAKEDWEDEED